MRGLLRLYQFWLAVGLFLLALFLGWGLPMIVPSTPENGILITIIGAVISAALFIWAFRLYKRQQKARPEEKPSIVKDTKIKLKARDTDKAIGMDIDNVPMELSNVQVDVTAQDVKEVTGVNVSARNRPFAVKARTTVCSCGYVIQKSTTCGYEPIMKCPKCGKEYRC